MKASPDLFNSDNETKETEELLSDGDFSEKISER